MNTMQIDDCFISLIKQGIKKHEYRLANDLRRTFKIGDIIRLESKITNNLYVDVLIEDIKIYPNWDKALIKTWKEDFNGLYKTFDEVKNKCESFYLQEEVIKYGIIVFTIKPL